MRVLVLALGNPILSDDGVAFHVLELLRSLLPASRDLVLDEAATGGLDLLPLMRCFDRVLVIDAVKTHRLPPGTIQRFEPEDFQDSLHADSPHHTNFVTAIELGRRLHPGEMPGEIAILGIEAGNILDFSEELTEPVAAAVPLAAEQALAILRGWGIEAKG